MSSEKTRKQRKRRENAPKHRKRKMMSSMLSEDLKERYGTNSVPVIEGDEVEVMRGGFKGHIDTVAEVDRRNEKVFIEDVTVEKADESKEPFGVHPSNLKITDLDLSDPWRKEKLENIQEEDNE
ncbi:MAG: 50S ribosomal protein L24 [Candidatus Thermoplasmatota archaeon]